MFLYSQILQKQSKSFSVDVFVEEGHQVKHHHLNYFNISLESLLNYARVGALLRRFFIFNSHSTNGFSTEYGPYNIPRKTYASKWDLPSSAFTCSNWRCRIKYANWSNFKFRFCVFPTDGSQLKFALASGTDWTIDSDLKSTRGDLLNILCKLGFLKISDWYYFSLEFYFLTNWAQSILAKLREN